MFRQRPLRLVIVCSITSAMDITSSIREWQGTLEHQSRWNGGGFMGDHFLKIVVNPFKTLSAVMLLIRSFKMLIENDQG